MRVIGGHDYYDSASAFGVDKSIVFTRKPLDKIVRGDSQNLPIKIKKFNNSQGVGLVHVVFAGVLYRGFRVNYYSGVSFLWSKEQMREFEAKHFEIHICKYNHEHLSVRDMKTYFDPVVLGSVAADELAKKRISIAIMDQKWNFVNFGYDCMYDWVINTTGLKEIGFPKVLDSYRAYQNLYMYIDGVLPKVGHEMVALTDNDILHKHGFDKWTFRKQSVKN